MTILELITGAWAIQPEKLRELQAIYATHLRGEKIDIGAIEARLGRPLSSEQQAYTLEQGGVALLRMSGVIAPKANLFMQVSGGMSTQMATKQLESAAVDPRVTAIVMAMDTPGGNVIGTPEMAAAVFELSKIKPIVTHTDGALASAGYWIGSAANAVYISGPTVQVGSIGVVVSRNFNPNSSTEEEHIVAGKYKRLANSKAALSEESRAVVQADVDYVYTLFVDDVARFRSASAANVLEHMADGRVFRGQQALDAGLVDGVITLDALLESMAADPAKFKTRRKAVFALGKTASTSAGAQAGAQTLEPVLLATSTPENEGTSMDRATLEQQHPALFAQIRTEFMSAGATAERDRIQAVEAQLIPGHEAVIAKLKYDGTTTGGDAAMAVNAAERTARETQRKALANDAPGAVALAPAATVPAGAAAAAAAATTAAAEARAKLPLEERCKAEFEESADLQAEFASVGAYTSWARADASGLARVKK